MRSDNNRNAMRKHKFVIFLSVSICLVNYDLDSGPKSQSPRELNIASLSHTFGGSVSCKWTHVARGCLMWQPIVSDVSQENIVAVWYLSRSECVTVTMRIHTIHSHRTEQINHISFFWWLLVARPHFVDKIAISAQLQWNGGARRRMAHEINSQNDSISIIMLARWHTSYMAYYI